MKYKIWDDFKVHCSGISRIMTRPKTGFNDLTQKDRVKLASLVDKEEKTEADLAQIEFFAQKRANFLNPPLSESAKSYLIERYGAEKYNIRRASAGGRQKPTVTKGVALENEGIELVKFIDKIQYHQPDCPISNDYMSGMCDILCYENKRIIDIKTSWNAANFMGNRRSSKLAFQQWCQIQGYMELYDINDGQVCHVLVNTPPHLIDQEKINLFRRYTFGEITRDTYDEEIEKYDSLFDYGKIPINKRIIRFDVKRFPEFAPMVARKVDMCREWLNAFERTFLLNKNIVTSASDYLNVQVSEENSPESDA